LYFSGFQEALNALRNEETMFSIMKR